MISPATPSETEEEARARLDYHSRAYFEIHYVPASIIGLILLFAVWLAIKIPQWNADIPTTMMISPDGQWRVSLVELKPNAPLRLDRNFEIRLENLKDDSKGKKLIFTSGDEGRPIGSERFIWSSDSESVLLVGRQFLKSDEFSLPNNESVYFLYHLPSEQTWLEPRLLEKDSKRRITPELLQKIEFTQPVIIELGPGKTGPN